MTGSRKRSGRQGYFCPTFQSKQSLYGGHIETIQRLRRYYVGRMGIPSAIWRWLATKAWLDWLCLFLIINPYFLCYYGYDSIGSIMDETGTQFSPIDVLKHRCCLDLSRFLPCVELSRLLQKNSLKQTKQVLDCFMQVRKKRLLFRE